MPWDCFALFTLTDFTTKSASAKVKNLQLANLIKVPIALRHSLATTLLIYIYKQHKGIIS